MANSVKQFKLQDPSLTNGEIAQRLGLHYESPGVFARDIYGWVGARVNRNIFTLHKSETHLHTLACKFAEEIGES